MNAVAIDPHGERTLITGPGGRLVLWDLATGRELVRLVWSTDGMVNAKFAPNETKVVGLALDGVSCVWDVAGAGD